MEAVTRDGEGGRNVVVPWREREGLVKGLD